MLRKGGGMNENEGIVESLPNVNAQSGTFKSNGQYENRNPPSFFLSFPFSYKRVCVCILL